MRNLLALLGTALVAFLAIGWYLDWYQITPKPGSSVEININSRKIEDDVQRGVQAGKNKVNRLTDRDSQNSAAPQGRPSQ